MIDARANWAALCRAADAPPDCPGCGSKANQCGKETVCWHCHEASELLETVRMRHPVRAGKWITARHWSRRAI